MLNATKFKVAGVTYYEDNLLSIGYENQDFLLKNSELFDEFSDGDKVWEYEFAPSKVELIPEPENEYDPNAVRVEIDGVKVGHIKKGSCSRVKNLIASPHFSGVRVASTGFGRYKRIWEDDDGKLHVERGTSPPWVHIEIMTETEAKGQKVEQKIDVEKQENERKGEEQQKATERQITPQKRNGLGMLGFILGIILYALSLLLIIISPLPAFAFSLVAVGCIYYGLWLRNGKKKIQKTAWIFVLMIVSFVLFLLVIL